ncbi:MAG TPA: hypothetical protein P5556_04620 [Candidatus Gastranaerophilales bacterium]|nr:hypothetical protein [Candidatus Gastranaerophilales bacterium]
MKKYFFFTSIILIIYFITAVYNQADWDLWHRLAAGRLFFETGSVPKHDVFAYTPVKDLWIDHEWGSGALFYFIGDRFGDAGLSFLKFKLLFLTFLPVFLLNKLKSEKSDGYRIFFYALFFYSILFGFLNIIRSQSFTFAFFALWIYLLELIKRGNYKLLLVFPLTTILWANLHGGFLAGIGILFLYGIGEIFNGKNPTKYFITAFICGLSSLINPYGVEYWKYLEDAVTLSRTFITEWQPLDLFGPFIIAMGFKLFLLITIVSMIYLLTKKPEKINWSEVLILVVTCYLSVKHIRHNVFFVIASAAYIQEYFYCAVKHYFYIPEKIKILISHAFFLRLNFFKEVLIYGLIVFVGILTVIFVPFKVKVSDQRYPVKSVEFIKKNNLSGNLLVLFNWGSYALWELYPECKVAMDGRYEEVYSTSLVNESARFHYLGKDWIDFMKNYKADLMLIDKSYPVFSELLLLDDWKLIHQDKISAVFISLEKNRENWVITDEELNSDNDIFEPKKAKK